MHPFPSNNYKTTYATSINFVKLISGTESRKLANQSAIFAFLLVLEINTTNIKEYSQCDFTQTDLFGFYHGFLTTKLQDCSDV